MQFVTKLLSNCSIVTRRVSRVLKESLRVKVHVLAKKGKTSGSLPWSYYGIISSMCRWHYHIPTHQKVSGIPRDWGFTASKSGWITSEICTSSSRRFINETNRKPKPIMLTMDELLDLAKYHVDLLYLPLHASHFLQSLDIGYFNLLKQNMGRYQYH